MGEVTQNSATPKKQAKPRQDYIIFWDKTQKVPIVRLVVFFLAFNL